MLITANAMNGEIRPDDLVLIGPMDICRYLVGVVTKIVPPESPEHSTGNINDDVHVDLTLTDYSEKRKEEIAQSIGKFRGGKFQLVFDDMIMIPDNLIRITGIDPDALSKLLESREEAKAYCTKMIVGDFEEGAIIGSFHTGGSGGFSLYVDSNDPIKTPHFHVQYNDTPLHVCIEFERPVYFPHDEAQGVLDAEQVENLIEFLNSEPNNKFFIGTCWNLACWDWNKNNYRSELPEDFEMPDFTKLLTR